MLEFRLNRNEYVMYIWKMLLMKDDSRRLILINILLSVVIVLYLNFLYRELFRGEKMKVRLNEIEVI